MHDYLLLEEVARIARVPVGTVRTWIRAKRLPSVRPGRWRLVRRADLEQFLKRDGLLERQQTDADSNINRSADGRFKTADEEDG